MIENAVISGYFQPRPSATTSPSTVCARMATCGVLCSGCVRPNTRGRAPLRPSEYRTREAAVAPAFEFASAELMIAKNTSTQPAPQNMIPRSRHGFADDVAVFVKSPNPVPITHAYEQKR